MVLRNYFVCCLLLLATLGLAPQAGAAPDVSTYPLGANLVPTAEGGGVVFRVWAPNATSVTVAGTFNSWNMTNMPLTKNASTGIWSAWISSASSGQQYKFVLGGSSWKVDPYARDTDGTLGNAFIRPSGTAYNWTATNWQTPDHDRMVIYELHVGTFSGNGDSGSNYPGTFRDVIDRHLADLKTLGVNMVEVMPVHEFPGGVSWGYNPVHFFAPESDYGSPDDFRYMIDRLHANGIGVMLDVVYNHTSTTDNNLWDFDGASNIYFFGDICQGQTDWGATRPKYTSAQVRQLILDNVSHWMREYRLDGLRVDATSAMRGYCNEAGEGWLLMGDITDAARAVNSRAIVVAEELPNTASVTQPRNEGGAGYDAQWSDPFNDTMRAQLAQSGGVDIGSIANVVLNSGFGRPNAEAVKYLESHDEVATGGRFTKVIDSANPLSAKARELGKVCGGLMMLAPGLPMLLQGQEFMEDKNFGDQQADRIWWGFLGSYGAIRTYYSDLIALRKTRGSLRAGSGAQQLQANDSADVLAFQRYDGAGDVTVVIANLSATNFTSYLLGVPQAGGWFEVVNSATSSYLGSATANGTRYATATARDGQPATLDVTLPAYSLLVFSRTPVVSSAVSPGEWAIYN